MGIIAAVQRGIRMHTGLKGRVALVTGASQGMGLSAAEMLSAEGALVAVCARHKETIESAAESIGKKTGATLMAAAVDVTDSVAVRQFVKTIINKHGRLDICVANAGGPPAKNFLGTTTEDWQRAFETNFLSVVHLAREVVPIMQKNRWGRFITITSTSVRQPVPDLILSNAIRPSVVGLIKSLAGEFGRDGITFNNVAPGYIATQRLRALAGSRATAAGIAEQEIYDRWVQDVPLRRLGEPGEIADAIAWLASERASYVTGQTILVDGGIYKGI